MRDKITCPNCGGVMIATQETYHLNELTGTLYMCTNKKCYSKFFANAITKDPLEELGWIKNEDSYGYNMHDAHISIADNKAGSWYNGVNIHARYMSEEEMEACIKIIKELKNK